MIQRISQRARCTLLYTLALSITACGGGSNNKTNDSTNDNTTESEPTEERIWLPPGGVATVELDIDQPFLQFLPDLDLSQLATVSQGRELFVAEWEMAPGARPLLDGLGPLAVADSCIACHLHVGRAASLNDDGTIGVGLLFRLGSSDGDTDPHLGGQLQTLSTVDLPEGEVHWQYDSQGKPAFFFLSSVNSLAEGIHLGPRLSPQLTGVGLLHLVSEDEILQFEDPEDIDGDGISGRAHYLEREGLMCLGRFGWKAMQCTLRGQSAGALQQDMGLTTSINPQEPCTATQTTCQDVPSGGSPEVSDDALSAMDDFLSVLAVSERRMDDEDSFNRGADLFESIACDTCHRPQLHTGEHPNFPILNNQTIYPYTDLLLHDMGEALSDGVKEGDALPQEWRTPPLWGVGLIEGIEGSRFLHDGRAQTITEAIDWHGGEANDSKESFNKLTTTQRDDLLYFLRGI